MPVYAVAQLSIHDRETYNRYQSRFMDVFRKFQGRLLAADESPQVVEGSWTGNKVVMLSFPDEKAYRDWADSPEYEEIARDRKAAAHTVVLLVQGF